LAPGVEDLKSKSLNYFNDFKILKILKILPSSSNIGRQFFFELELLLGLYSSKSSKEAKGANSYRFDFKLLCSL
jgi:hypothetical protein